MEEIKKEAIAGTTASGKVSSVSDVQCIPLRSRDGELSRTGAIRLHPTFESALRESQTRIQNL